MYTGCTKHLPAWPWTWPGGRPPTLLHPGIFLQQNQRPQCTLLQHLVLSPSASKPVAFPTDAAPGAGSCLGSTTAFRCPFLGAQPVWDATPTWVLLLLTTRSSNTTENERPPYVRHHKHFTGSTAAVIYSLQSVGSGFKALPPGEHHRARSGEEAPSGLPLHHGAKLLFWAHPTLILLETKPLPAPAGTSFT